MLPPIGKLSFRQDRRVTGPGHAGLKQNCLTSHLIIVPGQITAQLKMKATAPWLVWREEKWGSIKIRLAVKMSWWCTAALQWHCTHKLCSNCIILLTRVNIARNSWSFYLQFWKTSHFFVKLWGFNVGKFRTDSFLSSGSRKHLEIRLQNIHPWSDCLLHKCTGIINPTRTSPVSLSLVSLVDKYFHECKIT